MTHNGNGVKTSVSLTLEGVHEAVKINGEVVPTALFPIGIGTFYKEGFYL